MAHKFYIPINGRTKEVKQWYIPMNGGFSKKVKKAYVNVGGLSKLFYSAEDKGGFWFFYKTKNNDVLITDTTQSDTSYYKKYTDGITFFFMVRTKTSDGQLSSVYREGFFSTDSNAVDCRLIPSDSGQWIGSLQYNGETWYYRYSSYTSGVNDTFDPSGCIIDKVYPLTIDNINTLGGDIVKDMLGNIYTDDFAENYVSGRTYNLKKGNIEKTVRKAIAIFLYKNVSYLSSLTAYQTFLANVETVVNYVLGDRENYNIINIQINRDNNNTSVIRFDYYFSDMSVDNIVVGSKLESEGYNTHSIAERLQVKKSCSVYFYANGRVEHFSMAYTGTQSYRIGVLCAYLGSISSVQVLLSNVGLKFKEEASIYSSLYPNANVYDAGTVSQTNGRRSPVTKRNDGDAVVFISKNATTWDNSWIYTCCIALTYDAAILDAPNEGLNVSSHVIDGTTYYFSLHTGHPSYDGATQVSTPIGVPIFDELFICNPNSSPTTQRVTEILQTLGIQTS